MLLNERRAHGAPAERFESQRPGPGEQVDHVMAGAFGADQVEKRFARAMLHGPHLRIAMILQPAAAKRAANDAHFGIASVGTGRPALSNIFRAFMCHRNCNLPGIRETFSMDVIELY